MAKKSIRLNHQCNLKECRGEAGDIVETDEETAEKIVSRGGGKIVQQETKKQTATSNKPGQAETATAK